MIGPRWTAVMIGLAVVIVALSHLAPRDVDYVMVDELATHPSSFEGATVRAHGFVVPGTIVTRGERTTFVFGWDREHVRVFAEVPRPAMFKDQSELVIRGRVRLAEDAGDDAADFGLREHALDGETLVLDADDFLMKCNDRYDSPDHLAGSSDRFE